MCRGHWGCAGGPGGERGLQEHVPERGTAARGRPGTRGCGGRAAAGGAAAVAQRPAALRVWCCYSFRAEGSIPLWAIHCKIRLHDLCGPFQFRIFCGVTPAVPRLQTASRAELVALALPLVLCSSLPWLGLPSAFCCLAGVSGQASGVVVTSKWHCYPTACCPHPGPLS